MLGNRQHSDESHLQILAVNRLDWSHPAAGGGEIHFREVLSRLVDRGHEVTLICSRYPDALDETELEGVRILYRGLSSSTDRRVNQQFIVQSVRRELRRGDYDVVYRNEYVFPYLYFPKGAPVVSIIQLVHLDALEEILPWPLGSIIQAVEQYNFREISQNQIVTVSKSIRDVLVNRGLDSNRISVVYNGVDERILNQPIEEFDRPTLLFLSNLEQRKGVDMLPEIHQQLLTDQDVRLIVAGGDGNRREPIAEYCSNEKLAEFRGYVSDEEKARLMNNSHVFILPTAQEGYGMVIDEANAGGTPVVATDVLGVRDAITDGYNGYLVPRSIPAFVDRIDTLLRDEKTRQQMSENALSAVSGHRWDKCADQIEQILRMTSAD